MFVRFLEKKPSCLLRKAIKNSNSKGYYWQHGRERANLHVVVQIINVNIRIFADKQLIRGKKYMVIDLVRIPSKKRKIIFLGNSSQSCSTKNLLVNSTSLLFFCSQRYFYLMFQPFFFGGWQLEDCYLSAMLYKMYKHICNIFVIITSSCSSKLIWSSKNY